MDLPPELNKLALAAAEKRLPKYILEGHDRAGGLYQLIDEEDVEISGCKFQSDGVDSCSLPHLRWSQLFESKREVALSLIVEGKAIGYSQSIEILPVLKVTSAVVSLDKSLEFYLSVAKTSDSPWARIPLRELGIEMTCLTQGGEDPPLQLDEVRPGHFMV
jgi:hypothetical protein